MKKYELHLIIDPTKGPKTEEVYGTYNTYDSACSAARQIDTLYRGMFWWVVPVKKAA